ncbi:Uu.00g005900.m01.CDS01 [Anthostomella pinea]|uniref:Uu.00g005900.m01.CDS01 n=1 Tax=Anthostomella pinea TaxID=933095 RepID=A0AAI8VLD1_9PEZI|nr:Uu.00g005900.m01.CDS01 [Anthostomella pinea]
MGKPSAAEAAADSVSLHTNPGESSMYIDDDAPELSIDDLPPTYDDAFESSEGAPMLPHQHEVAGDMVTARARPGEPGAKFITDLNTGAQSWVTKTLENPTTLEQFVRRLATVPPRPYITIVGTHSQTTKDSKGKTEKKTITDFDVSVELTPYLYSDAQYRKSWTHMRTVDNGEKARRGTVFQKRAPGSNQSIEVGNEPKPTLQEWCHRYAASHAGLKVFTLQRRMVGFDEETVKARLETMVRGTNYRGHLQVRVVTKDAQMDFYNNAKLNRWRFTTWIQWLCTLTLLFIFTWPYLYLRTKRWEVAVAEWPYSRMGEGGNKEYVSISEDQWYNMWGRAICKAVLEKRQKVLDQEDLRREAEAQATFNSGNETVDGAVGLFRAGIFAMNEVNRQLGWGGDC